MNSVFMTFFEIGSGLASAMTLLFVLPSCLLYKKIVKG